MLYSQQHKFIFIKTVKTASTSLEICLSKHLGDPRDIITPISPEDEKIREANDVRPRNFSTREGKYIFWNHMSAAIIKRTLPAPIWEECKKVTSERHPYEKAVSSAFFRMRQEGDSDLQKHIRRAIRQGAIRGSRSYTIDGKMVAGVVIRYEHLLEDTNRFLESLGLPAVSELPRTKSQSRTDSRPAREILTDNQKRKIQAACAWEFEHFGYEP